VQNNKSDRRTRRTRKLLKEALVALMLERDYGRITVQDIVERANVGRSTFYMHYEDKEDLLLRGVAGIDHRAAREAAAEDSSPGRPCPGKLETISTLAMFSHVKANGTLRKIMHRSHPENALLEKGTAFLYTNVASQLQQLAGSGPAPAVPIPLLAHFLTGGLMSLVWWWTETGMPQSPLEMDAAFQQVAMPGVLSVLGKSTAPR
jgi:AcrR family transcriptional regulator